ncbi:hypothetical protein Ddc_19797 [Ditylenchus destructor]|nr:hypothetical protein Ddc_19797 [Ditylenchus destructor]
MDTQNIPCCALKRRPANSSPDQNQQLLRKKVDISGDTWLDALKFLTFPQWSQKRFVSRQINGIAERNISSLPMMVIDSAAMYYIYDGKLIPEFEKLPLNKYTIVAFDTVMQEEQSTQWLKNRGFTLDAPADISAENALIAARKLQDYGAGSEWNNNVNICIQGSVKEEIELSEKERRLPWFCNPGVYRFIKPVLFYAQFNPFRNNYSWNYLAQFLNLIYHPTSYVKEVSIFAVNQDFIDLLQCNIDSVDNQPRYIRCESFWLEEEWHYAVPNINLPNSLKWLARNVRAETIRIRRENYNDTFVLLANFLLEASGAKKCASKEMKVRVSDPVAFLNILIEKFYAIPLVESAIPTTIFQYASEEEHRAHLGPNLIAREVDSEGTEALYVISNGQNRMRISFCQLDHVYSTCKVRIYPV